jgi:type I restriction-modification system DNA methylase subunit
VEIHPQLVSELRRKRDLRLYANDSNHSILCKDFLFCSPTELGFFDAVVMNPPFADNQATYHVAHALSFLKPGGCLIAVMPAGIRFRDDRATRELRARLESWGASFEDLPEGTFSESGTQVNTVLMFVRRPE